MVKPTPDVRGKKPSVYEKGRRCESTRCGRLLTRYNPGPFCYAHATKPITRLRP